MIFEIVILILAILNLMIIIIYFKGLYWKKNKYDDVNNKYDDVNEYYNIIKFNFNLDEKSIHNLLNIIYKIPKNIVIKIIITSYGGNFERFNLLFKVLTSHPAGYIAYIPKFAHSGGTLLAIGAKKIIMHHKSLLGMLDPICYIHVNNKRIENSCVDLHNIKLSKEDYFDNLPLCTKINDAKRVLVTMINNINNLKLDKKTKDNIKKKFIFSGQMHYLSFNYKDCLKIGLPVKLPNAEEKHLMDTF